MPKIQALIEAERHLAALEASELAPLRAEHARLTSLAAAIQTQIEEILTPAQAMLTAAQAEQNRTLGPWCDKYRDRDQYVRYMLRPEEPTWNDCAAWLRGVIYNPDGQRIWTLDIRTRTNLGTQRIRIDSVVPNIDNAAAWSSVEEHRQALLTASDGLLVQAGFLLTGLNEPTSTSSEGQP